MIRSYILGNLHPRLRSYYFLDSRHVIPDENTPEFLTVVTGLHEYEHAIHTTNMLGTASIAWAAASIQEM